MTEPEGPRKEPFDVTEWLSVVLFLGVCWFFLRAYRPEDAHRFGKFVLALIPFLLLYGGAKRFFSEKVVAGVLAFALVLVAGLAWLLPHHAVVQTQPRTGFRFALYFVFTALAIIVWPLIIVSVYVAVRGGGKRWRWFAERYPFVAEFTYGLSDGIIPFVLLMLLADRLWELTG